MKTLKYTVRFNTPAFLGNARQSGQWRTPPFKALLRQWWRVAAAREVGYDDKKLREKEGKLFGHAWLENDRDEDGKAIHARASKIRVRLDAWTPGKLQDWGRDPTVFHPEVGAHGRKVGAHLYLGYGPLTYQQGGTSLKADTKAIDGGQHNVLRLAWSDSEELLDCLPQLFQWFGTVGGRSRNGWGSFDLQSLDDIGFQPLRVDNPILANIVRPLDQCLRLDWPHALGSSDGRPLVWYTENRRQYWRETMQDLARIKIEFRTRFQFTDGKHGSFEKRHLLAYPVTRHNVLGGQARLANQLRFKVIQTGNGQYRGLAYHLPCGLPDAFTSNQKGRYWKEANQQIEVWQTVHQTLDQWMERI